MAEEKLLRYNLLRLVTEKTDGQGNPVPFSIKYICMDGEIMEARNVVTTSVDVKKRMRTLLFLNSGEYRTIHDVLVMQVNDRKIIVT